MKKLLTNSKIKNASKYAFVAGATFLATKFWGTCNVCYAFMLLGLALLGAVVFFAARGKLTKKGMVLAGTVTGCSILSFIAILLHINLHNTPVVEQPAIDAELVDEEVVDEEITKPGDDIVITTSDGSTFTIGNPRGYCNPNEKIKTKNTIEETLEQNNTTVTTEEPAEIVIPGDNKADEEAEKAIEEADKKPELDHHTEDSGIVVVDDNKDFVEKDEFEGKTPDVDTKEFTEDEDLEKLVSDQEDPEIAKEIESDTEEKKLTVTEEESGDAIEDYLKAHGEEVDSKEADKPQTEEAVVLSEEKTETSTVVTEEVVEINNDQEVNFIEDVEDISVDSTNKTENTTPVVETKVEEIQYTAVDGFEGFVDSDIQFIVKGDNVSVYGIEGTNSTFRNGVLNINSSEATIVSVTLDNGVSSVSFDVTVNGYVK